MRLKNYNGKFSKFDQVLRTKDVVEQSQSHRRTIMKGIVDSEQWDFLVGPILILRALLDAVTLL